MIQRLFLVILCCAGLGFLTRADAPEQPLSGPRWSDRRPIARVFLARSQWCTQRSVEPLAAMLKHEKEPIVALRMLRALVVLSPEAPHTRDALRTQITGNHSLLKGFAQKVMNDAAL